MVTPVIKQITIVAGKEPYKFTCPDWVAPDITTWCLEHFGDGEEYGRWWTKLEESTMSSEICGAYTVRYTAYYFSNEEDATLIKLRWG